MMKLGFDPCAFPGACCPDCSRCRHPIGVLQCQGCCKIFCTKDSHEHRQELKSELREIIHESEQLNACWKEERAKRQRVLKGKQDQVMQCIEEWEARAMAKIKQASAEAREQACKLFEHHWDVHPECEELDATALTRALEIDGFLEQDLEKWRKNLQCWKTRESSFETDFIRVRECEPFIPKIVIEGQYTRCPPPPPCVQPEPCVWRSPCCPEKPPVYRDPCAGLKYSARSSHSSAIMVPIDDGYDPCAPRDRGSSVRRSRYKIKCVCADCSSKSSYTSQFGWGQSGQGFINAHSSGGRTGCQSGLELGDTYALVVDCDQRNVCLTNERTNKTYALDIDPSRGPLPKQLHVRFLDS